MDGDSTGTPETSRTPTVSEPKTLATAKDVEKIAPVDDDPEPTTFTGMIKRWPKATFCIIGNEFCERFSFVGMRTVLTLYVMNILAFSDDNATILFHSFIVLCYFTPLFGSILADGYIGKFWTILWIALVYAAGNVTLAIASTFPKGDSVHPYLDILGLVIIGIGTGGIKPCVSAFGGDQFNPNHLRMLSIFFSVFYFTVNAGSMISSVVTPIMRTVPCNGLDSCYPMAFGIPAGLMVLATLSFASGSIFYKKLPPKENVFFRVCGTIGTAIRNKITHKTERSHWLEHYFDTHDCDTDPHCIKLREGGKITNAKCAEKRFVDDVKSLIRVVIVLLPVPFFWSLYDQQGSRWIIQAVAMNSRITDSISILPDQVITINAVLVLLFIPLFQTVIYPLFDKHGIRTTPLRRLVVGGFLGAASFVVCGIVQLSVNETLPVVPDSNTAFVSVINSFSDCNLTVKAPGLPEKFLLSNSSLINDRLINRMELYEIDTSGSRSVPFSFKFDGTCGVKNASYEAHVHGGTTYYMVVSPQGITQGVSNLEKPTEGSGQSKMNINFMLPCSMVPESVTWGNCRTKDDSMAYDDRIAVCGVSAQSSPHPCNPRSSEYYGWSPEEGGKEIVKAYDGSTFVATNYAYKDVRPGKYQGYYVYFNKTVDGGVPPAEDVTAVPIDGFTFEFITMGGVYSFTLDARNDSSSKLQMQVNVHSIVPSNNVNILLQLPQYVIISAAEVLFSITGLEFAYSQAAPSMKSVVQALWLLTVAFGDLIIIIIAKLDLFSNLATEMFAYAGGLFVVIFIFMLIAIFYYDYADFSDEIASEVSSESAGTDNASFVTTDDDELKKTKV